MEQGNCSAGDNSASFGVLSLNSEFDCANRIKLKCVSVLTGDPLLLHFCFTLRFAFLLLPAFANDLADIDARKR